MPITLGHTIGFDRRTMMAAMLAGASALFTRPASAALFSRRIAVRTEGAGRDVVLLPGLGAGPPVWNAAVAAIPDRRYTYVHVRGFAGLGAGDNRAAPLIDGIVAEAARYIETAGLKRPAIVGHSMGGMIGMLLARRRPDLVGRLMVVDMLPAGAAMLGGTASGFGFLSNQLFGYLTGTAAGRRMLADMVRDMTPAGAGANDPEVIALALNELAAIDLSAELSAIKMPMTVVYAVPADRTKRRAQVERYESAYAGVAGVKLGPMGPSGHMVMTEQPAKFAAALQGFLG